MALRKVSSTPETASSCDSGTLPKYITSMTSLRVEVGSAPPWASEQRPPSSRGAPASSRLLVGSGEGCLAAIQIHSARNQQLHLKGPRSGLMQMGYPAI